MAGPNSSDIRNEISNILEGADLASLSSKKVRKLLEKTFETDLSSRKKEIDKVLMEMLAKKEKSDEVDEESTEADIIPDETDIPQKQDSSGDGAQSDSSFESPEDMDPPVSKSKKSKGTSSSSHEIDDAELARRLQEEDMGRRTRHSSHKKTHKKAKKTKAPERSKKGVKTGYNSDMVLSPELAEIMGTDKMSRAEVVKRMWQIVKERQLAKFQQHQISRTNRTSRSKNKQYHICDDQLLKVFGTKRVRTFSMMKYLKRHIKDPELLSDSQ